MDGLKLLAHSLVDMASAANLRLEVFSVGQHAHTVGASPRHLWLSMNHACNQS